MGMHATHGGGIDDLSEQSVSNYKWEPSKPRVMDLILEFHKPRSSTTRLLSKTFLTLRATRM